MMSTTAGKQRFTLAIDATVCHHCRRCLASQACRIRALMVIDPEDGPFIDMSRCMGCLKCVITCPFGAVIKTDDHHGSPVAGG